MMISKKEYSINGWWMPTDPYEIQKLRHKQLTNVNSNHKFKVYLCTSCSRVYESAWECGVGRQLYYYKDFPTLGLKRIKCKYCNKNGN
tara:strand:+ start:691 stop:954 length:264 start_codon:yes stop_codon:yes gene_type:complete